MVFFGVDDNGMPTPLDGWPAGLNIDQGPDPENNPQWPDDYTPEGGRYSTKWPEDYSKEKIAEEASECTVRTK